MKTNRVPMKYSLLSIFILTFYLSYAQDPLRFKDEVEAIQKRYDTIWDASKETILFTGSSSIRRWHNLQKIFPNHQIVNTGFGSSQASDLLHYPYELILRYKPKKVFIYEGDNDIWAKKNPNRIIKTIKQIIDGIHRNDPRTEIILIAAKPSIARWNLRKKFRRLNRKFERLAAKDNLVRFADVWKPMIDGKKVKGDIFLEDNLHMNEKGYEIWFDVVKECVNMQSR